MINSIARRHTGDGRYQPDPAMTYGDHPDYIQSQRKTATFVGLVAIGLPTVLAFGAILGEACFHDSMSHFYYTRFLGSAFIGGLIFIGSFLLAYRGETPTEKWLASFAGICAIGVAVMPTQGPGCEMADLHVRAFVNMTWDADITQFVPVDQNAIAFALFQHAHIFHSLSAGGLFLFLAYYTFFIFTRVVPERHLDENGDLTAAKKARNRVYRVFGVLILVGMIGLVCRAIFFDRPSLGETDWWNQHNLTFWLEALAVWSFGISWVVKGHGFAFLWPDPDMHAQTVPRRPRIVADTPIF